jgi:hypothetical protein
MKVIFASGKLIYFKKEKIVLPCSRVVDPCSVTFWIRIQNPDSESGSRSKGKKKKKMGKMYFCKYFFTFITGKKLYKLLIIKHFANLNFDL